MKNKNYLIHINNDLFNISNRVLEIDKGYRIYYNSIKNRIEVHNIFQIDNTLAVVNPYETLDKRLLDYIIFTSIKNNKLIYEQIEENNLKIAKEIKNKKDDYTKYNLNEIYKYAQSATKEFCENISKSTLWL